MAITLTKSYQRIATVQLNYGELRTYAKYSSQSSSTNKTTYQIKSTYYASQWLSFSSGYNKLDGTTKNYGSTTFNAGETTLQELTRTLTHNNDGSSPTKSISNYWHATFGGDGTATGSIVAPKIARYFTKTPVISLGSNTTTSLTINWSTSENCNRVRYKLNNGSWVDAWTGSSKSGSFTISGLEANTSYTVVAECRRADSNLTSNSNTLTTSSSSKTGHLKVNGENKDASPYIRVNGEWKLATQYIRVNNEWKRSR